MAKRKHKKLKSKVQAVNHPDGKKTFRKTKVRKGNSNTAAVPAPLPLADPSEAHDLVPAIDGTGAISKEREEGKENSNTLSGFIFMCNAKTKLECYQNRVFGLPAGKMEVVEKIKQGTKLFLFDFDVKLLYGIYTASSPGKLDLETAAFGGKFRAQVRFEIYKDCLPLPEIILKTALKDIYKGSKFAQELNDRQVRSLISLFHPIGASSSAPLQPPEPNVAPRWPVPSSAMDSQVPPLSVRPFVDPCLAGVVHEAHDLVPAIDGTGAISKGREEGKENINTLYGFIFMCNAKTKLECYQNRVFGLPAGKMEVVEKIKQGTKLFLFDFDVKLLYGIYTASSPGKFDLEPAAFGGKFRAQVRFEIYKDCLPLPESIMKTALKDIYKGSKFTQELNDRQVRSLISLFHPIGASSSAPLQPPEPNAAPRWPAPSSAMDSQVPPLPVPPFVDPYLAGVIHGHPPSVLEPPSVQQKGLSSQNGWYGTTVTMDYAQPATEDKGLFAPSGSYRFMEGRQSYVPNYPSQTAQDPYLRYNRTVQEMFPQEQLAGPHSGYHQLAMQREREIVAQYDVTGYSSSYTMQTPASQYVQPPAPQHMQPPAPQYVQPPAPQHAQTPAAQYVQPYVPEHVQPPAAAGRLGLSEGSMPISSFYAFAGASQITH